MHDRDAIDPVSPKSRRMSVRDTFLMILTVALILLLSQGASVREAGESEPKGVERTLLLAVGHPTGWVSDQLPFSDATADATEFLDPDAGSVDVSDRKAGTAGNGQITADAFDPLKIGARPAPAGDLKKLLITGDSLVLPMDGVLTRELADRGVRTIRDARLGTGISKLDLGDWPTIALEQTAQEKPDATVIFIGANEGFDLEDAKGVKVKCCSAAWAALYANRARSMMAAWRQGGKAKVYWVLVPGLRDAARQKIARVANEAFRVAASPFGAQVRLIDLAPIITPGGKYRDEMEVGGGTQIIRDPDGIHLNEEGAKIAAKQVIAAIERDYGK